VERHIM